MHKTTYLQGEHSSCTMSSCRRVVGNKEDQVVLAEPDEQRVVPQCLVVDVYPHAGGVLTRCQPNNLHLANDEKRSEVAVSVNN